MRRPNCGRARWACSGRTWRGGRWSIRCGRFGQRFGADLVRLQGAGLPEYHRWAFAGLRQLGADAELAGRYLHWLAPDLSADATGDSFDRLALQAKALLLKAARAVNSGRALDAGAVLEEMAAGWDAGMVLAQQVAAGARDCLKASACPRHPTPDPRGARRTGPWRVDPGQNRLFNVIRSFSRFIWNRDRKLFPNKI